LNIIRIGKLENLDHQRLLYCHRVLTCDFSANASIFFCGKQHPVYFHPSRLAGALENATSKDNTLTAWFKLNQSDTDANEYLYPEIPEHYTFVQSSRKWKKRQRGHAKTIGRMYTVSITQGDIFYLRLLLLHVRGAQSFEEVRTVDGIVCETFKEAAIQRNLLEDDKEWENCLAEAEELAMPRQLRHLFAIICVYCSPSNPFQLWENHKTHFIEDFVNRGLNVDQAEFRALSEVECTLSANGKCLHDFNLKITNCNFELLLDEGMSFVEARQRGDQLMNKLNPLQKSAFDKIMKALNDDNHSERLFFLDGPGGSGKTFTYNTLYYAICGIRMGITNCASTGIAASLLPFGNTYHSTFGLGPNFTSETVSSITIKSRAGKALAQTKIIVWDECTMTPHYALDVIDRLIRDLTNDKRPFGGKIILLGGDFRQTLPIVRRGNRVKTVETCLKSGRLWHLFTPLKLCTNERTLGDPDRNFSDWLLELGDGTLTNSEGLGEDIIEIPPEMVEKGSLIDSIFGKTILPNQVDEFKDKAILTPKNEDVHKLNYKILQRLEGNSLIYPSVDSILLEDESTINPTDYPVEYLNTLQPGGCPVHYLALKKGAIIMLLRNLNKDNGLCNGTRMVVEEMLHHCIVAKVMSGKSKNEIVYIPRIDIATTEMYLPFQLKRRQFPIMLAFVMTINKSQGQSMTQVGIYLPNSVFSHGQLYVAFSRCRSKAGIRVQVLDNGLQGKLIKDSDRVFTKNVVYKEVFDNKTHSVPSYELGDDEFVQLVNNLEDELFTNFTMEEWNPDDDFGCELILEQEVEQVQLEIVEPTHPVLDEPMQVTEPQPCSSRGVTLQCPPSPQRHIYYAADDDSD
jgi:PIF1-like helicase